MNPKIAKPLAFFALFAIVIGAGCAIGMNFYANNPVAGICCIVLAAAAVPAVIKLFNYLRNKNYEIPPVKEGDEFITDQGEKFRYVGINDKGEPICERIL